MEQLLSFCQEASIPPEQAAFFAEAYGALQRTGGADVLEEALRTYFSTPAQRAPEAVDKIAHIADEAGIHILTLNALFVIRGFISIREAYIQKYGEEIYRATAGDLSYKINECIGTDEVIGITAISWSHLLLRETIFMLGRLQFHIVPFPYEIYEANGYTVRKDEPIIKIHIPSAGKLTEELCFDAYRRAYRFFKDQFKGDVIPFMCSSWMLYERNSEFFPEGGNLARFMTDFDIIENKETVDFPDLWRVFGKRYTDFTELPRDNRLRNAMADYLLAGNRMGYGIGFFFHDGKNIIK